MRWRTELMFQVAIFTERNPPMLQLRNTVSNTVLLKISLCYSSIVSHKMTQ